MALELYRVVDCLEYVGPEPRLPVLKVTIREPITRREETLVVPVDTGFAGYLLVPRNLYEKLGTAELPRSEFGVYTTMVGPITLRRARVTLKMGKLEVESYIETPMHGGGKLLLGRRVLKLVDVALIGRKGLCCGLSPTRV
jgi:clan AA aspartic protease